MAIANSLSVKECLGYGWKTFKARPWFLAGTFVAYLLLQVVLGSLQEHLPGILSLLLSVVVSTLAYCGLLNIYLKAHEDPRAPSWMDLWYPKPFWPYLGVSILLVIIVAIGLILLVVPGIIAAVAFSLAAYLVIDKGRMPIAALKESARLTKGNRWKLFLLGLAVAGLSILGAIPLFLGLLIVAPVSMVAAAHAYRTLAHQEAEAVPAVDAPAAPAAS